MSSLTTLARPYARAAFELAQAQQALPAWSGMLDLAAAIMAEDAITVLIGNPDIRRSQVLAIVTEAAGEAFDDRFRGYLSVMADNDRLPLLPQVADLYRRLRETAENRMRVMVISAVALDENQSARLKEALARRLDCEIELENEIDAGIIGGAVVYAGNQVIDGSLRGRLNRLSASLAT